MAWTKTNLPMASIGMGGPTEGLWTPTVDQMHRLGEKYEDSMGRVWRYAKNGSTALGAGLMTTGEAVNANVLNEAQTAYGVVAVGDTRITVLVTTSNGIVDGELADGWLVVQDNSGEASSYAIANNTYIVSDTVISLELYDPIRVAWAATTEITLVKNLYRDIIVCATTPAAYVTGVPNMVIPASYYGWIQRRGPCAMVVDSSETLTVGCFAGGAGTAATAGAVGVAVITEPYFGDVITIGAADETALIYLKLE